MKRGMSQSYATPVPTIQQPLIFKSPDWSREGTALWHLEEPHFNGGAMIENEDNSKNFNFTHNFSQLVATIQNCTCELFGVTCD